jgi:hypothetical protein
MFAQFRFAATGLAVMSNLVVIQIGRSTEEMGSKTEFSRVDDGSWCVAGSRLSAMPVMGTPHQICGGFISARLEYG